MDLVGLRQTWWTRHSPAGDLPGSRKAVKPVCAAAEPRLFYRFRSLENRGTSRRGPSRTRRGLLRQCVMNTDNQQEDEIETASSKLDHVNEEWRREVGMIDSVETMTLNREHGVAGFVRVSDGRGGLPKVTLTHPSGSECDVYLHGANILSWNVANGGEVFFTPESEAFDGAKPICWGTPVCFPQFGEGGHLLGGEQEESSMPADGFAQYFSWSILQTGIHEGSLGEFPYVSLELTDNDQTRSMWNHSFRLRLDISLNCASVDVEFEVENTSAHTFEYAAALKSHIAVKDVEQQNVKYNGLDKCMFIDDSLRPNPRVVTPNAEDGGSLQLIGPTQRVYLNSQNATGVEVGTGCTVYLRDKSEHIMRGFNDRAVWNMWKDEQPDSYRWYAGLAIGAIGKLIKLEPEKTNISCMRIEVADVVQSDGMNGEGQPQYSKQSAQRSSYDLKSEGLPMDMQ